MSLAEWYLMTWQQRQHIPGTGAITLQIDPGRVFGRRDTFGPALFFPYTLTESKEPSPVEVFSLEGWIGWGQEGNTSARLRIPSQTLWPHQELQVPLTDVQIEAIEEARKGGLVQFNITFTGQAVATANLAQQVNAQPTRNTAAPAVQQVVMSLVPVQSNNSTTLVIEREQWLRILQRLGSGTRRLVELTEPRLPRQDSRWAECLRLLDSATQHYRTGAYEQALVQCRQIVEGIPQVLCQAWGLTSQRPGQAYAGWLEEIKNRLRRAWPEDELTPSMLSTLLAGAWTWLAPAPHYGTGIPLREEVAFALGLITDLLLFSSQALQAHPQPIVAAP